MKGSAQKFRWDFGSTVIAASMSAVFVLTGCNRTEPVTAPTSTLPPPGTVAETPAVPPYETELDLTDEEKKEVEAALVALDGYISTLNRVFSSGGADSSNLDEFAQGEALDVLTKDASQLKENDQYMAGEFKARDFNVSSISQPSDAVTVHSCVDNAGFSTVKNGDSLPKNSPDLLTVEFIVKVDGSVWKVDSQGLWSESCAD